MVPFAEHKSSSYLASKVPIIDLWKYCSNTKNQLILDCKCSVSITNIEIYKQVLLIVPVKKSLNIKLSTWTTYILAAVLSLISTLIFYFVFFINFLVKVLIKNLRGFWYIYQTEQLKNNGLINLHISCTIWPFFTFVLAKEKRKHNQNNSQKFDYVK